MKNTPAHTPLPGFQYARSQFEELVDLALSHAKQLGAVDAAAGEFAAQPAGTKAAVIGGTQLLYGTGLNQLLQLSHCGVVISRGRCGRRRNCWSRNRGYLFNLLLLGLRHHGPLWFLYQRHRAAR